MVWVSFVCGWDDLEGSLSMRISSNIAALTAQRVIGQTEKSVQTSLQQLASGNRFVNSGIDPAGMAIAEGMKSQIKGYTAARNNAENATSFVALAESALNEQNNILIRMRELAIQSASDTYSDTEREFLDQEFQQISQELDRIARTTSFGSKKLLQGDVAEYEFQVGVNKGDENVIKYTHSTNTTAPELGVEGLAIRDQDDARDSLESLDQAMVTVGGARAKLGAVQNRMDIVVDHIDSQVQGLSEARSKIADTDIPSAVIEARRGQVLQAYQASTLAMALEGEQNLLKLVA